MFWLILAAWIVGGVIALVLLILIVGRFLPERYEAQVRVTFQRPPEDVWAVVGDYRKHPMAGSMAKKIEELPTQNGMPAWVEDLGSSRITVITVDSKPPIMLVRELSDNVVPMTSRQEIQIEPLARGCAVTANNKTQIRSGTWHVPIFRFIMTITRGNRRGLANFWKRIAKELGEIGQFH